MMNQRPFDQEAPLSAEEMHAFMDDELCAADRQRVRSVIAAHPELTQRICHFDQIRDWLREAYATPPSLPSRRMRPHWARSASWLPVAAAAILLVGIGGLLGWWVAKESLPKESLLSAQVVPAAAEGRHILVRWGSDAPEKAQESLAMVKALLAQSAHEPGFQLEVLANADGVRLLSAQDSPYAAEIAALVKKYPGVRFLACGNSLKNLEKTGERLRLLPHVQVAPSAVDQVASRLREGWSYLSI